MNEKIKHTNKPFIRTASQIPGPNHIRRTTQIPGLGRHRRTADMKTLYETLASKVSESVESDADIEVAIAPKLRGHFTRRDLLRSVATIMLEFDPGDTFDEKLIFRVVAPGYALLLCVTSGYAALRRNDVEVLVPSQPGRQRWFAVWSPTEVRLHVWSGDGLRESRSESQETSVTFPPNALLDWARRETIASQPLFPSAKDCFHAVVEALQSIDDQVSALGMHQPFWDLTYDGARIVDRQPKHETGVQPSIHGLLWNLALAKNLDVSAEHQTGGGRLDLLISGPLEGGGKAKVCVEVKNAHSDDLEHGLLTQLPAYMRAQGSDLGVYVVCWFKGRYFDGPTQFDKVGELERVLDVVRIKAGLHGIRVVALDLSVPVPPSKQPGGLHS